MGGTGAGSRRIYGAALLAVLSLAAREPDLLSAQAATQRPAGGRPPATALAFKGVTVIDVTDGQHVSDQTVIITGNRIQTIGPARQTKIPSAARIVDAQGKYLVPGFWDMHTHVDDAAEQLYPRFIANGVTGMREMAQRGEFPDSFRVWQREVMAGTRVGPRGIGPSADLSGGSNISIATPDEAVHVIDSLKAAGDAFAKYHGSPNDPSTYFAILREARKVGLPITGHLPSTVPNAQAADSGHEGVEHIIREYQCVQRPDKPRFPADSLEKECAAVAQAYIRNGTWLTPTITIDYYRYFVGSEHAIGGADPQVFKDYQEYLRRLYRLGVRNFLTGTDCPVDGDQTCGFTLLQELVLLGESGLPPLDVLQAATLHPAQYLRGTDSLGTVAPGKLADLVLLDADPLADIRNVMTVRAVVANGRYFDRATLDTFDPEATGLARRFAEVAPSLAPTAGGKTGP